MDIKIENLDEDEIIKRNIRAWPIWEKEVSRFDWHYDQAEECLILEGEIVVETDEGAVTCRKGDFVTFRQGLSCIWDVKKPIRKHYNFR